MHYQSHVDNRYKKGLLRIMLDQAHRLSSSWTHFPDECDPMKTVFSWLKYPKHLVKLFHINIFVDLKVCNQQQQLLSPSHETDDKIQVVLPFKDQISADIVKKQLKDLSLKVHTTIQPVFVTCMVNVSLLSGHVSENWKATVVTPPLKKPGLDLVYKNFRPVSNLSFISKVVEKAALQQLLAHCEINSPLPKLQSGFHKYHSTETALLKVQNNVLMSMDNKEVSYR